MARFLMAWEFGDGLGHVGRFRPLAQALRAQGHEVDFMLREIVQSRTVLGDLGLRLLQAPIWLHPTVGLPAPSISLTEILAGNGYLQAEHLDALVQGWLSTMALLQPDVLVADYAPTATLAARILGIPVATVGSAFYLPPDASPLPPFRAWEPIEAGRVAYWDRRLLQTINAVLARHGAPAVNQVADILRGDRPLLCSWPELDPYQRGPLAPDQAWLGPGTLASGGEAPSWPEGDGPQVFAYLRSTHADLAPLLQALADHPCRTLCYLPELAAGRLPPVQSDRIRYTSRPVSLQQALPQVRLLVSHAGASTVAQALQVGVPMLLLPTHTEQFINAQQVAALGAGLNAATRPRPTPFAAMLRTLLDEPACLQAAQATASRYRGHDLARLPTTLAEACISLLPSS